MDRGERGCDVVDGSEVELERGSRTADVDAERTGRVQRIDHRRCREVDVEAGPRSGIVGAAPHEFAGDDRVVAERDVNRVTLEVSSGELEDPVARIEDEIGIALVRVIGQDEARDQGVGTGTSFAGFGDAALEIEDACELASRSGPVDDVRVAGEAAPVAVHREVDGECVAGLVGAHVRDVPDVEERPRGPVRVRGGREGCAREDEGREHVWGSGSALPHLDGSCPGGRHDSSFIPAVKSRGPARSGYSVRRNTLTGPTGVDVGKVLRSTGFALALGVLSGAGDDPLRSRRRCRSLAARTTPLEVVPETAVRFGGPSSQRIRACGRTEGVPVFSRCSRVAGWRSE